MSQKPPRSPSTGPMSTNPRSSLQVGHIRERLSKRGETTYQVIVSYRAAGRRHTLSGTRRTVTEARKLLVKLSQEAEVRRRASTAPTQTVGDLLDRYFERSGSWSATTTRQLESLRARHYDQTWGDRIVGTFDFVAVEEWIRALQRGQSTATQPLERSTLQRILNPLALAYDRALKVGLDTRNPFREVKISECVPPATVEEEVAFDDELPSRFPGLGDALRALDHFDGDGVTEVACRLLLDLGLRRGELCGLRWSDLDVDECLLHVRRRAVLGPGDKLRVVRGTKTAAGRSIAVAAATMHLLDDHHKAARAEAQRAGQDWEPSHFMFWTPGEPGRPMRPDLLSSRWRRACARAGVRVRLHDLRHLHASILLTGGVDLATVADRLGHSGSGRTTLMVYAHGNATAERAAAEMLAGKVRHRSEERG